MMTQLHPKMVLTTQGQPIEVILPWTEYQELVEILGLDLSSQAQADLIQARQDREQGNLEAYLDLEAL
jgi:hypothetical protein